MLNSDRNFKIEKYDEFYEHHLFKPLYDSTAFSAHRVFPRIQWALDVAKEIKAKRVLDLGCLEGYTALTLLTHCPSVEYVEGVDLSQEGIGIAQDRVASANLGSKAKFVQGTVEDWLNWYIKNGMHFDLICNFELMEHVKDPELVIELMDKVKTKDGTVLISTPDFEAPTFGKDDEGNKCHIRLYTLADEDYEGVNKYGNTRTATSLSKQIGKKRIVSMEVYSELINCRYS
jgi:2-polyprenyl-3-methyl-5-hydroxy-6-metoxy-1,4-benzoquinol methylase